MVYPAYSEGNAVYSTSLRWSRCKKNFQLKEIGQLVSTWLKEIDLDLVVLFFLFPKTLAEKPAKKVLAAPSVSLGLSVCHGGVRDPGCPWSHPMGY